VKSVKAFFGKKYEGYKPRSKGFLKTAFSGTHYTLTLEIRTPLSITKRREKIKRIKELIKIANSIMNILNRNHYAPDIKQNSTRW
jgi:hypothetical protein